MPSNRVSWDEALATLQAAGPALTTNNVSTSMINAQAKALIPANSLYIGKMFRIKAAGVFTGLAVAGTTHSMSVKFGSTLVFTSAWGSPATAVTTAFDLHIDLVCRSIGSAATMFGWGKIGLGNNASVNGAGNISHQGLPMGTPGVGSTFDSTADQIADYVMTIQTANITSIQLNTYSFESLN